MSDTLTNLFGTSELVAFDKPHDIERQFAGFPGAHGVTSMFMGSRGTALVVKGTLRAESQAALQLLIRSVAALQFLDAADYSHQNYTYYSVVWGPMQLIDSSRGTPISFNSSGQYFATFIMQGRSLI